MVGTLAAACIAPADPAPPTPTAAPTTPVALPTPSVTAGQPTPAPATATPTPTAAAPTPTASPSEGAARVVVQLARTSLGQVVADGTARTLYGFVPDAGASAPTCNDTCAQAWPPLIVEGDYHVADLDEDLFRLVTRDDGFRQLAIGQYPLYHFSGDTAAGQVNGQGIGGNWFVLDINGELIGRP